jgi:hypothetical protein
MFEPSEPQTIVGTPVMAAELAWDLADTARGHLDTTQRNRIYIAIAVGDTLWAITLLLRTVVGSELGIRADLLPKLLRWVTSYRDHPAQGHLQHLIGRVRIQPLELSQRRPAPQTVSATAARQLQPIRRVSGRLQDLRPVLRRTKPEKSRRFDRRKPQLNDFNRQPSAQQRTGSFGYE